jgi:hypothetical protein
MQRIAAIAALALLAGSAAAQVATLEWVFDDPNGNGTLVPGQTGTFTLWATMDPQGTSFTGFAGSIYDIHGTGDCWTMGSVDSFDNYLDQLTDDGELTSDNQILGVESFQLPPLFNPDFDASNPIALYQLQFTPVGGSFGTVGLSSIHINFDVYVDDFGTSIPYSYNNPSMTFECVPSPGAASLALVGLVAFANRRRS